nr:PREDICTED: zinc finger protein 765-like [Bemisia tabaci]
MKMPAQFECGFCGKSFSSKTNWRRHEKQKHRELDEGDKFGCPDCGRYFIRKHDLCRHIVARHTDLSKEQHACEVCDKAFARESLLKEHMKVHEDSPDGSQKLICHLCCVPFKSKKFLERHIKLHAKKNNSTSSNTSGDLFKTMQLLQPYVHIGKNRKKSSKNVDSASSDEDAASATNDCERLTDEENNSGENQNMTGIKSECLGMKTYPIEKFAKQTENDINIEELSPDQYVIDYVKNKMKETEQESHRQQFLLSLLPDVNEMSNSQFRSFRQNVCSLIDTILQPGADPLRQSNEESSSTIS